MIAFCLLMCFTPTVDKPTIRMTADRNELRLSDVLMVTVTVEGSAPLRVKPPEVWVSVEKPETWILRPSLPARTDSIAPGRQRWTQLLVVEPMASGDAVPLTLSAVRVSQGDATAEFVLDMPTLSFHIVGLPQGSQPRGYGPIELLPETQPRRVPIPVIFGMVGMLFSGIVLLVKLLQGRRKPILPAPSPPTLDELTGEAFKSADFAAALRAEVQTRLGVGRSLMEAASMVPPIIREILSRCEAAIYGPAQLGVEERKAMMTTIREHFATSPLDPAGEGGKT